MKILNYKDLNVWQKGIDIVDTIYELTNHFPSQEKFGLFVQMRRSAVSIPANIAEGFMRSHRKEYVHFLYIALGSGAELETQVIISQRRNYLHLSEMKSLQERLDHLSRMLRSLIGKLQLRENKKGKMVRTPNPEARTT